MNEDISRYLPLAQGLEVLLHPYAEIVIHDLATKKIAAIYNNFSKRNVGDDSLIGENEIYQDVYEPYYKTNWDGRRLKSTTVAIKNKEGKTVALFCVNLDISHLSEMQTLLNDFMGIRKEIALPKELFQEDWREKIGVFVNAYLKKEKKNIKGLNKIDKQKIVLKLYEEGAFRAKHAAQYVADVLDISRATVYKYVSSKKGD